MKTIKYKFADGTVSEVEVSNELFAIHEEMAKAERRNHWKNTRRHDLLSTLNESDIDIPDDDDDIPTVLIEQEHGQFLIRHWKNLDKALELLPSDQSKIIELVFYQCKPIREIAEEKGIHRKSVHEQLAWALKKLLVILKKL